MRRAPQTMRTHENQGTTATACHQGSSLHPFFSRPRATHALLAAPWGAGPPAPPLPRTLGRHNLHECKPFGEVLGPKRLVHLAAQPQRLSVHQDVALLQVRRQHRKEAVVLASLEQQVRLSPLQVAPEHRRRQPLRRLRRHAARKRQRQQHLQAVHRRRPRRRHPRVQRHKRRRVVRLHGLGRQHAERQGVVEAVGREPGCVGEGQHTGDAGGVGGGAAALQHSGEQPRLAGQRRVVEALPHTHHVLKQVQRLLHAVCQRYPRRVVPRRRLVERVEHTQGLRAAAGGGERRDQLRLLPVAQVQGRRPHAVLRDLVHPHRPLDVVEHRHDAAPSRGHCSFFSFFLKRYRPLLP
eukprot:Rhum_TRINITY_DN996_c0_g1::Rhum_TRINITY_DN996_c0_g1_i1::g.2946::m.2946